MPFFDQFRWDPARGLFQQIGTFPATALRLETLTNGRFAVTGNQVRDYLAEGNPVYTGINTVRPTFLIRDDSGNVWLSNQTDKYKVNKPANGLTKWAGEIASVVLPNGERITPENTTFSVTAFGTLLYVRESGGKQMFRQVGYDPSTGRVRPGEFLYVGERLATPDEALRYGAAGWLADRGKEIVARAIAQGLTDEAGNPLTKITEAAIYLAAQISVSAARVTKLN